MTAALFLAEAGQLGHDRIVLAGAEGHHAARVRRVRPGEPVDLTDGRGHVAECLVAAVDGDTVTLDVRGRRDVPPPRPRIVVVQALPKGDRGELAVEMLTEVGADVIVPWPAARCVVEWRGERGGRALERWRAHARESAKQARRPWLPEVREPASTTAVAELLRGCALGVVLHESATARLAALAMPVDGDVGLVVGPEGGITDDELSLLIAAGGLACRLGDTVLRSSTAGVAAAAAVLSHTVRWHQ
ncbi:MAG: 16S rRNA (uracil(1498)-N(3))-methyltransferase [Frankiaceae bacterium]